MSSIRPIGIFDSGYGGLTVFKSIRTLLPQYDYIYLGDNARAPYGNRSFETVYEYTLQAVWHLFRQGCPLVIIACNTASAKALRSIQQINLPKDFPQHRVLGVIRPTAEIIGTYTKTGHIGLLGTRGTVLSRSYLIETDHFFPEVTVFQQACPMWVPIIENGNHHDATFEPIIQKDVEQLLAQSSDIDTVLLACTHYPLIADKISQFLPPTTKLVAQGSIVAESLQTYLGRHPEIERTVTQGGHIDFLTTDDPEDFDRHGVEFFGEDVHARKIDLESTRF